MAFQVGGDGPEFVQLPPGTLITKPRVCTHGRIVGWAGWANPGERLPEIEHCEECNPGAVPLDPPEEG